jgi:hypothetical protein
VPHYSGYNPDLVFRQDPKPGSHLKRIAGLHGDFPGVIIAGAQKSGTTSLYAALASHPDFQKPQLKEPFYYGNDDRYYNGRETYLMNFPKRSKGKFTVDASTNYLDHPEAAVRILKDIAEVKVVIILRDPVYRAFSHYRMQVKIGAEKLSFSDALQSEQERIDEGNTYSPQHNYCYQRLGYRTRGEYSRVIKPWLTAFNKGNLLVMNAETFFSFPEREYAVLLDFLQLRTHKLSEVFKLNAGKPEDLNPEAKELLIQHYRPGNIELASLVNDGITRDWLC